MSVWMTKSSGRAREYVVLKHTLRGVNYSVNGIKFRNGFAVVEKDSKTYRDLKRIPVLKAAQEFPLLLLKDLPFITRPLDVKIVYGVDVFMQYMKQLDKHIEEKTQEKKVEEEVKHIEEHKKCSYKTLVSGGEKLCKDDALAHSPSGYCLRHILEEPKLVELDIEVPRFIPKKEKWDFKKKVSEELAKLKEQGKF